MSDIQSVMDAVALMIGGTAPDLTNRPGFYSGYQVGDGTGIAGLRGCWSNAPEVLEDTPIGVLLPGPFTAELNVPEVNIDDLKLRVFVARADSPTAFRLLTPFRDSVPAVFRAKMQSGYPASLYVAQGFVTRGDWHLMAWADTQYLVWEFTVQITRDVIYQYTA